jgi:hypothetical protein
MPHTSLYLYQLCSTRRMRTRNHFHKPFLSFLDFCLLRRTLRRDDRPYPPSSIYGNRVMTFSERKDRGNNERGTEIGFGGCFERLNRSLDDETRILDLVFCGEIVFRVLRRKREAWGGQCLCLRGQERQVESACRIYNVLETYCTP